MNRNKSVYNLSVAGICLALAMVLPFLTGQIPQIGSMLSPMHIPVLLCGFLCAPAYAFAVGLIAPILRFFLFGMPPLMPFGLAMSFELAAYGLVAALLYKQFKGKKFGVYVSLIGAMLIGRIVWGVAMSMIAQFPFTLNMFIAGAFINAVPGIILHIILIPLIVIALERAGIGNGTKV